MDFYRRGTSTRVTYYTSFEGDGATTPTGSADLDTYGGGVFYVNETVTVVVKDSTGTELRRFVSAYAAAGVEVISQSFTGTDYDSGATGASEPVPLSTALDALYTSFGAKDFNVLIGGVATSMQEAFATVGAAFINVKAELYGAIGDGVANDTSAIQAALDAAETAGGGTVFFPAGTYKTSATLTVAPNVSLLGAGPAASRIACASAAVDSVTMEADVLSFTSITGLRISASVANSKDAIDATAGRLLRVSDCLLGDSGSGSSIGLKYDGTGTIIFVINTTFDMCTAAGSAVYDPTGTTTAHCHIWACKVRFNGAYAGGGFVFWQIKGTMLGTIVVGSGMTSGSSVVIEPGGVAGGLPVATLIAGCTITNPTGGTLGALSAWTSTAAHDGLTLIGNRFGTAVSPPYVGGDAAKSTYYGAVNFHRERARYYVLDDTAAVTVDPGTYCETEVERTTTGAQTCTLLVPGADSGPAGESFTLVYNNLAQGSVTGTITMAGEVAGLTTFTVNANRWSAYFFRSVHYGTDRAWALVGSLVNQV